MSSLQPNPGLLWTTRPAHTWEESTSKKNDKSPHWPKCTHFTAVFKSTNKSTSTRKKPTSRSLICLPLVLPLISLPIGTSCSKICTLPWCSPAEMTPPPCLPFIMDTGLTSRESFPTWSSPRPEKSISETKSNTVIYWPKGSFSISTKTSSKLNLTIKIPNSKTHMDSAISFK